MIQLDCEPTVGILGRSNTKYQRTSAAVEERNDYLSYLHHTYRG